MQPPTGIKRQALFQFSFQLSQGRAYNLKNVPQKPCFKICRRGGGGGGRRAIRVCRGWGSHCKMKVFSMFTVGPKSSKGSGGMFPQKILKIRYPDWLKLTFLDENCDKIQLSSRHIYTKVVQKRITPQACFTNSRLKNKKFTASRTEIDSIMYHDQTFNHDITTKYIKFTFSRDIMTPKTHHAKMWGPLPYAMASCACKQLSDQG